MIHNKWIFFAFFSCCLGFAACENTGNKESDFADWDGDQNELIDNNEFENAFSTSPYFDKWNKNENQYVTKDEFYKGYAALIDENNDDVISESEWNKAVKSYFNGYKYQPENDMSKWNNNNDDQLSREEVIASLQKTDYFSEWDKDGDEQLSEKELARGVFTTWDTDGDGVVQAKEYTDWYETGS